MELEYAKTPKQLSDGRFFVKVCKPWGEKLVIQLNNTVLCTSYESSDSSITISVNEQHAGKIVDIDTLTVQAALANSVDWFKRELKPKTVNAAYSKSITSDDNTMNVEKMGGKAATATGIYDHKKNAVENRDIPQGTVCDVLVELTGVWFLKTTFGLVWRVVQIRLKPPSRKKVPIAAPVYMFQDETPAEEDEESSEGESDGDEYK